ncbi:MAG: DNA repair protein RadA, partial [Bacteroidales bacterium]|nr:DNA repair protein RadA [Bacteroidales bacterium]
MASAKSKTVFFCSNCGNEYSKWMGRCPACGEWNTMIEKEVVTGKRPAAVSVPGAGHKPMPLKDVSTTAEDRVSLGSAEVDRLLGGGIVKGSLVLMGGEPGIGKSTLSLQLPLGRPELKTLYVTGEESVKQVK